MSKQKYIIVECDSAKELQELVNDKISSGYEPVGGVCCVIEDYGDGDFDYRRIYLYMQSMVLKH